MDFWRKGASARAWEQTGQGVSSFSRTLRVHAQHLGDWGWVGDILACTGTCLVAAAEGWLYLGVGWGRGCWPPSALCVITVPPGQGNVVLWKPSDTAMLASYAVYRILREAGLPPNIIQFVPADGPTFGDTVTSSEHLCGINFTGSVP